MFFVLVYCVCIVCIRRHCKFAFVPTLLSFCQNVVGKSSFISVESSSSDLNRLEKACSLVTVTELALSVSAAPYFIMVLFVKPMQYQETSCFASLDFLFYNAGLSWTKLVYFFFTLKTRLIVLPPYMYVYMYTVS